MTLLQFMDKMGGCDYCKGPNFFFFCFWKMNFIFISVCDYQCMWLWEITDEVFPFTFLWLFSKIIRCRCFFFRAVMSYCCWWRLKRSLCSDYPLLFASWMPLLLYGRNTWCGQLFILWVSMPKCLGSSPDCASYLSFLLRSILGVSRWWFQ